MSITPQVSDDDWISLDISPVLTSLKSIQTFGSLGGTGSGGGGNSAATAPDLDTKQASTLVRVRDGTTVVLGGLIQTQKAKNDTKIPVLGDIPILGRLFTGTFRFNQKKELVIFVTPHIVRESVCWGGLGFGDHCDLRVPGRLGVSRARYDLKRRTSIAYLRIL